MQNELEHVKRAWDRMGTSPQGVREQVEKNGTDLGVQFQRIAMMQAEIDRLKANETTLQTEIDQLRAKNPRGLNYADTNDAEGLMQFDRPLPQDRKGPPAEVTDDTIRSRAYELYESRGGEPGADVDDWLRAERELREATDGTEDEAA